eukprot:351816-Chlamydomonas_euryale.AAC.3
MHGQGDYMKFIPQAVSGHLGALFRYIRRRRIGLEHVQTEEIHTYCPHMLLTLAVTTAAQLRCHECCSAVEPNLFRMQGSHWGTVAANSRCKRSLQTVAANSRCKQSLQTVAANHRCKRSLQTVAANSRCKRSLQTVAANACQPWRAILAILTILARFPGQPLWVCWICRTPACVRQGAAAVSRAIRAATRVAPQPCLERRCTT